MSKSRGIIFGADSVRAIMAGRKSQTRRVVKPSNSTVLGYGVRASSPAWAGLRFDEARARTRSTLMMAVVGADAPHDLHLDVPWDHPDDSPGRSGCVYRVRPVYEPGSLLYVKESWADEGSDPRDEDGRDHAIYRADCVRDDSGERDGWWQGERYLGPMTWGNPLFMPRDRARLWLQVEEVRVERLQEISEEDAKAEGMQWHDGRGVGASGWRHSRDHGYVYGTPQRAFAVAWDEINGKKAPWDSNPHVWVIAFRPVERPEESA